ncbi:hypothetical protein LTR84_008723 [Exophiala bonariae]|uniref:Transcription factor domain-containing protein n=1 Tax=Exophiala bonariae TaxID=1690606 RepID=A0AAV9MZF8_9EURO|nr:hypothetical protein LTR84_008723 [Exophiala bonariae]
MPRITNEDEIPDEIKKEGIQLYFEHFHNRPYPLLEQAGKPHRAQAQVALGLRLAQTRGLLRKESGISAEDQSSLNWRSVVWTLFMMDRIFSSADVRSPCVPASSFQLFLMQCAPSNPDGSIASREITLPTSPGDMLRTESLDVISCNIVLLDIWHNAVMEVSGDSKAPPIPFWRHDSAHAAIESRLMEFEMSGWNEANKGNPTDLLQSFIHTDTPRWDRPVPPNVACKQDFHDKKPNTDHPRHHPFILFMKTRQQHGQVPLTTLQKSHQESMIHSSWVIRHIVEMEEGGMSIYDPFIGYLVALAASIQLEQTFNDNPRVANAARRKYEKAHVYLHKLADIWRNAANILSVLEDISVRLHSRRTISHVSGEYDGAIPSKEISDVNVEQEDIDLMAKLFDYASLSAEPERVSPATNLVPRHCLVASELASNIAPQSLRSTSDDSPIMETGQILPDPLVAHEELGWPNEDFEVFPDVTNEWSFFGRPWSTYSSEGPTQLTQYFDPTNSGV